MLGGEKSHASHMSHAHVVAVNMGYGHERPARVLRTILGEKDVFVANDYPGIPAADRNLWQQSRIWYERISRFRNFPVVGQAAFQMMDELQRIPNFYPRRDLSHPSLQLRQFYTLIRRRAFMRHLVETLAKNPKPILSTFMSPAFAAEEYGYPEEMFVLCTDSDISRAWAPLEPKRTRIKYFAPSARVAERLALYGVPERNIHLTGFPLPVEAIGGEDSPVLLKDLLRRLCNLDINGNFMSHTGAAVNAYLGQQYCDALQDKKMGALSLTFTLGGAGAQKEIGLTLLKSLAPVIRQKKVMLHLVAGTHASVKKEFEQAAAKLKLGTKNTLGNAHILFEESREKYFDAFSQLMRETDVLWTKPSELSFYAGLGLPIIIAPPVGSQEDFNRDWLMHIGAGIDQLDPRYAHEWLLDWQKSGALARLAWNGFVEAPTHGAYRIRDIVQGNPASMHPLPLAM